MFPIVLIGALVLGLAAALLWGPLFGRGAAIQARRGKAQGRETRARSCPLCSSVLSSGERIKSDIFPGPKDRIMRIFGCPLCWPSGRARICPVCGKPIAAEGWAVARYFETPGRRHVHVLGCTGCREERLR